MKAIALASDEFGCRFELVKNVYRLRRRIFRDRLDWDVATTDGFELDVFDTLGPSYIVVVLDTGELVGCVRLLPTTVRTMLGEIFAELLDGQPAPNDASIIESSRFCVDTARAAEVAGRGLNRVTLMLFAAMIECLCAANARSIVTVTDLRMERILRRAGWPLERLANPRRIGSTMAVAGFLHRSECVLNELYRQIGVIGPVLESWS